VKIEVLVLANKASTNASLLTVEGAGWERYTGPGFFPFTVTGAFGGIMIVERKELGKSFAAAFRFKDANDQYLPFLATAMVEGIRPKPESGVPIRIPFAIPFSFIVEKPGTIRGIVEQDGTQLASIPFAVVDPVPDGPSG
jgi:hypothetical protein